MSASEIVTRLYGRILKGRLVFDDLATLGKVLNSFKEDAEVEVLIKKRYKRRTSGQPDEETNFNGYYWGVEIKMIADHLGYVLKEEVEQLHYWIQIEVDNVVRMPDGTVVPAGTSHMSGREFSEFTSKVRVWASMKFKLYIPEPNEIVIK